jgi:hypothetical protein
MVAILTKLGNKTGAEGEGKLPVRTESPPIPPISLDPPDSLDSLD